MTDKVSLKLEYLHASFNRRNFNYDLFTLGPAGDEALGSAKLKINTVRIGFNYHF